MENLNQSFASDVSFIEAKFCLVEPAICSITVLAPLDSDWRCDYIISQANNNKEGRLNLLTGNQFLLILTWAR